MTRREILIEAAEKLFASYGYVKTSTLMIAKEANVSESLIFKHFHTKEGLLRSVLNEGYHKVLANNKGMLNADDPIQTINKILELPYLLVSQQPIFWKMQARNFSNEIARQAQENFMRPVGNVMMKVFENLGFNDPKMETELLLIVVDSLWKKTAFYPEFDSKPLIIFIKTKYKVQIDALSTKN